MINKQYLKKNAILRKSVRFLRSYFGQPNWKSIIGVEGLNKIRTSSGDISQNILIATGGGSYVEATHIESLISVGLKLRNHNPHILLCDMFLPACFQSDIDWDRNEEKFAKSGPSKDRCYSCYHPAKKMYESLGVKVHNLSTFCSDDEKNNARKFSKEIRIDEISNYKMNNVPVGEHAYAGALRFYAKAKLSDEHSDKILRRYFEASILTCIAVKRLIEEYNFKKLVLHHGIYVPQGVISETALSNGLQTVSWHVAYRKQTFLFSHNGTYHRTMMTEPTRQWENIAWNESKEMVIDDYLNSRWYGSSDWIHFHKNTRFDKSILYDEIGIDKNKPYVLMLTNVLWDAQLHYPNNAFPGMLEWVLHTIELFSKRKDIQLVVRIHPAEVTGTLPSRQLVEDEINKKFKNLPENIFIISPNNSISTYVIAQDCDCAIIYGTKTGVELSAKGIPVIVAGEAWIRNKGISIDVDNINSYEKIIDSLPLGKRNSEKIISRAKKYAYHFFFRRMIPLDFINIPGKNFNPYSIDIKSCEDIKPNKHKGFDVIMDGILESNDFIHDI